MPNVETYRRGQVEQALWQYFRFGSTDRPAPPPVFRTRIKRLLELDRAKEKYDESEMPHSRFAFVDETPSGQGSDVSYTPFNAFCLGLGLDLLDTGYKQSEVVFLLRHIRTTLEDEFTRILEHPPLPRQAILAEDQPDCPTYEENDLRWADCRVFMLITKVEIKEVFGAPSNRKSKTTPLIFTPVFCYGIEALRAELHRMKFNYRKVLVLELAHTAAMVRDLLRKTTVVKRGRK